ncbi:MAG: hypothetical protein KY469_21850 [Actinobacteria bacterium]|nr:hypothetical protein [Actinomycetota bacterium]
MRRRRQHCAVFAAAGIYNLAWGAVVALHPVSLYRAAGIPVPDHPEVASALGMVIGLYGILYLQVARRPEHGWLIAAVGAFGKIAGPAAFAWHVTAGNWPPDGLTIIVVNDLVWWLPFATYLHDAWPDSLRTRHSV